MQMIRLAFKQEHCVACSSVSGPLEWEMMKQRLSWFRQEVESWA